MNAGFLPYGRQHLDDDDIAAVVAALKGDYLTTGPAVDMLEQEFARIVGARHAVACSNGTAGLHLAAMALDLGPGDYVVVPAITFLATANAVRFVGAEVVFADVDPTTGLMRPHDLSDAVARSPKPPKAVFPVHLGGPCCDLPGVAAVAQRHNMAIVEDACHALGTRGRLGDAEFAIGDCRWSRMAVFSAHPIKAFTMGEGGVVTANDDETGARLRRLRNHGMTREPGAFAFPDQGLDAEGAANPWYYEMSELGYNYRATDFQCALGLSQLRKLDMFMTRRRALVARYRARIRETGVNGLAVAPDDGELTVGWHLFRVSVDFDALGVDRGRLVRRLAARGVGSQVHYIPLYRQPYYERRYGEQRLPGAERYYATTLSLPLHVGMEDDDADRVIATLQDAMKGARRQ